MFVFVFMLCICLCLCYVFLYVYVYVMFVFMFMFMFMFVYVYVYVYVCLCLFMFMFMFMFMFRTALRTPFHFFLCLSFIIIHLLLALVSLSFIVLFTRILIITAPCLLYEIKVNYDIPTLLILGGIKKMVFCLMIIPQNSCLS